MNQNTTDHRIIKLLQADEVSLQHIDSILDGKLTQHNQTIGPLLLGMGEAAKLLGVSRATLWRMLQSGKFQKVEILPGSYRLRRADLEAFVNGTEA